MKDRITEKDVTTAAFAFFQLVMRFGIEDMMHGTVGESPPGAFSRKDAAKYLGISISTLGILRRKGEIASITIGDSPKYTRRALDKYLKDKERN